MKFFEFLEEYPNSLKRINEWAKGIYINNMKGITEEQRAQLLASYEGYFETAIEAMYASNPGFLFYFFDTCNLVIEVFVDNKTFSYSINKEKFPIQVDDRITAQKAAVKNCVQLLNSQNGEEKSE